MKVVWTVRSTSVVNMSITGNIANNGVSLGAFGYTYNITPSSFTSAWPISANYLSVVNTSMTVYRLVFTKS